MVNTFPRQATGEALRWRRIAGKVAIVASLVLALTGVLSAQDPPVHYLHHGIMPPGAIGSLQLQLGGPLPGFFQPV